jgi:acetoacetate decarboxylase
MPDQGRLTEDLVTHTSPVSAPLYPPPPWKLEGARVLKVMFETDKEPLLEWLPPKLTRSSPPYGLVVVEDYPESPIGSFRAAHQFIGCRAGFFQRAYATQSVVNSPPALSALREVWGYPATLGKVELESDDSFVRAIISGEAESLCEISLSSIEPIDHGTLRLDPVLTLRLVPSLQEGIRHDLVQLLQIDPDFEIQDAHRGNGSISYPNGSPWSVLPSRNIISAVWCRLDTELPLARFVMPY